MRPLLGTPPRSTTILAADWLAGKPAGALSFARPTESIESDPIDLEQPPSQESVHDQYQQQEP